MSASNDQLHGDGGGGGGSAQPLTPVKRPHPDSAAQSSPSSGGGATKNEVILVSFQITKGPIGHVLYAITLPPPKQEHHLNPHSSVEEEKTIYPILEIPSKQCHPSMCCIKLKSKLYYFGAQTDDPSTYLTTYHRDVNIVNINESLLLSTVPHPLNLEKGLPMKEGKCGCYGFVINGKIYAIGESFEVFNPDSGENGQWTTLPRPKFASLITGHSVIDDKVVITTFSSSEECEHLHFFDLKTLKWGEFWPKTTIYPKSPAVFVQDYLYFPYKDNIVSLGPRQGGGKLSRLFDNAAFASLEVSKQLEDLDLYRYLSQLLYLGDNRFLYVMDITLPDPKFDINLHSSDPEKAALRVVVFEATGERFIEEEPSDGESSDDSFCEHVGSRTLFRTKLLHTSEYIRRSKSGTDAGSSYMSGCFSTSVIAG